MARILLDTHVLVRCLINPKRLSRDQSRDLTETLRRREIAAVSAITLWEVTMLSDEGKLDLKLDEFFAVLEGNPMFEVLPLTIEVARESAPLRHLLRDPADCIIVATARVHGLRLLTSDQRIIESNLVRTVA